MDGTAGKGSEDDVKAIVESQDSWILSSHREEDPSIKPLVPPIYLHSTVYSDSIDDYITREFGYIRHNNPTRSSAECTVNALEGGAGTLLFTSGMAAIATIFISKVHHGDHVIMPRHVYSGTHMLVEKYWAPSYNVQVTWVDASRGVAEYKKHIRANTKLLYGETPANPGMSVLDLEEFGRLGSLHPGIITVVDGTFASPYIQQPLQYGVDISVHSCTKYMGGHSDLLAGCLTFRDVQLCRELKDTQCEFGNVLSPWDSSLLLRGIRTLPLRVERQSTNAQRLAEFLQSRTEVRAVHYPGLVSHPHHHIAKKQMSMFGGMISFQMQGLMEAQLLVENVRLIKLAVSLGGVESLIEHPATMTHGPKYMDDAARARAGITDGLIRLSVGVENVKDLEEDLKRAMDIVSITIKNKREEIEKIVKETDVNKNIV